MDAQSAESAHGPTPDRDQRAGPVGMAVEGIESATFLTAGQKRDIFYDNAVRFFRLEGKQ